MAFSPRKLPIEENDCFIVTGPSLKNDYIEINSTDKKIVSRESLEDAINNELNDLGEIIFVLMGEVDKNITISKRISHGLINKITFSPMEGDAVTIVGKEIILNSLDNEGYNWIIIEEQLESNPLFDTSKVNDLKQKFRKGFNEIKEDAFFKLIIPDEFKVDETYFLESITKSIITESEKYNENLMALSTGTGDKHNYLNEILRISYNFVDDASKLIRLLVSVCDLKPIILWKTFTYHYKLNESIRVLPWTRQLTKPSLNKYIETIKKARNKTFHRLIPFSKAFEVKLPENSIKNVNLRFFSEYGSKRASNRLNYEDKELVDVLMEFTRTSEEIVSDDFWGKNMDVINDTINLLKKTASAIRTFKRNIVTSPE